MTTKTQHRVLLVGPWRADRPGGGGCCSAGPDAIGAQEPVTDYAIGHDRACAGAVLTALRQAGTDDDVELIDPRNTAYLIPVVVRDARRKGDGWAEAVRSAVTATTAWALVVDGRVISRGTPLTPDEAVAAAALARR